MDLIAQVLFYGVASVGCLPAVRQAGRRGFYNPDSPFPVSTRVGRIAPLRVKSQVGRQSRFVLRSEFRGLALPDPFLIHQKLPYISVCQRNLIKRDTNEGNRDGFGCGGGGGGGGGGGFATSPHRHIATKPQPPQEELGNNSFLVRKSVDLAEKLTIYQQRQMVPLFSLTLQL
jgi:hypothetical protein